jgi:cytochrome c-type biogenesis protein CcmE
MVSTRSKLVVALILVLGILFILIRSAVTHAASYYVTVSELYQKGSAAVNTETTVSANIVGRTVVWDPSKRLLRFSIQDQAGGKLLPVIFHGDRPDDFGNDWPVVVSGSLEVNGVFQAKQLLIKCPSKYKAATKTYNSVS